MPRAVTPKGKVKPKAPAAKSVRKTAQDKREIFLRQYRIHRNASRAYVEAGYQDGTGTRQSAHNLLTTPYIQSRLAEMDEADLAALDVKASDVTRRLTDIAFADISRITGYHIGCCRYCWGVDHHYQWRNQREYEAALHEAIRESDRSGKPAQLPKNEGGMGFTANRPPNPDCPECDGAGVPRVVFKDTRDMNPAERAVFAGVEITQHGIKYRLNDQAAALVTIAKQLQMFKEQVEHGITDPLALLLQQVLDRAQTMPLAPTPPKKGPEA